VEARNVNNKQERRDGRPLGGAYRDWGEHLGGPLVEEPAGPAGKERVGPRHKVRADPFGPKHAAECGGVDVVESHLYVKKERGDLSSSHAEGLYLVSECGDRVRGREAGQRAALVWIQEAGCPGHAGESGVHDPLEDLRKSLEQDYNAE